VETRNVTVFFDEETTLSAEKLKLSWMDIAHDRLLVSVA
jgi:hypothetical protein